MKKLSVSLRMACRRPSVRNELIDIIKNIPASDDIGLRWGFRRIPLSRGHHHGGYVCAFRGEPLVRVESALERSVIKTLVADSACVAVASQPVTIQWSWNGVRRRYTPDILVIFDMVPERWRQLGIERFSIIEVKPVSIRIKPDLRAEHSRVVRTALGMPLIRLPVSEKV
jgi:hypothetical protein